MNRKQTYAGFLWLALFTLLSLIGGGRFAPLAAWLAPIFAIRFYRHYEKGGRGFLWLWLVTAVTSAIVWSGATALHFISPVAEPIFVTLLAPIALVPFVIDRFYYRRWGNNPKLRFWLTLVYPISLTAVDYLNVWGSPFGSFGAIGYSPTWAATYVVAPSGDDDAVGGHARGVVVARAGRADRAERDEAEARTLWVLLAINAVNMWVPPPESITMIGLGVIVMYLGLAWLGVWIDRDAPAVVASGDTPKKGKSKRR